LSQKEGPIEPEAASHLEQGDRRLRQLLLKISALPELAGWRQSFNPAAEAWWWPEPPPPPPAPVRFTERFNWLWTALALALLAVSLSLIADIGSRFLSGDTDAYGVLAIVAPTLLTLFTTRSVLTDAGQKVIQRMLGSFKFIPAGWHEELGFIASAALLLLLTLFWFSLPAIARSYNDQGYEKYRQGEFTGAKADYERALALDPALLETHYNLGVLYEDLNQADQAQAEYQLAVQGYKLDAAYNNLARLYILAENYDAAVPLLLTVKTEKLAQDDKVSYDVQKNLGWARLGQGRYSEAATILEEAIEMGQNRAPAYCLLAQVHEAQQAEPQEIEAAWSNCLSYIDQTNPDEDRWYGLAQQYFANQTGD
jgi:tetratricopeptide (TPR) repeat protein